MAAQKAHLADKMNAEIRKLLEEDATEFSNAYKGKLQYFDKKEPPQTLA